ncbi:Membrane protein involved in the export of O-antigen and teichoic acid [Lachnospiraceae bacterium KH1T2]|nr:Membrane protein involved in the export of O-antigen and teichoic acid [Lachnospiraceae bacterium KH1T2]
MAEGKYKYLFKNMALFTISSFVSKMLVFLLVPFYTSVLSEAEYGIADVMQTTLLLLIPLLTLNAGEAALRFGLDPDADRAQILKAGIRRVVKSDIVTAAICIGAVLLSSAGIIDIEKQYIVFFAVLFICDSFYEYMLLYCQGTEKVQIMIVGSVSCTFLVIASNLVFLLILDLGLCGYLFAQMIAYVGAGSLMLFLSDGVKMLKEPSGESKLAAEMKEYGSSMLMYSTSSWINNALDRYYILALLGASQNGLYSAAYKIPAILQVFQRIFAQAWQMSAAKEYKKEQRDKFFSTMYRVYNACLVVGCAGIIWLLKIIAGFMFQKSFFEAWVLVPPLLISVIFGALEGFLGSICLAFKDGRSIGRATGAGAIVNIILNYVFIIEFSTMGAAMATLASYFTMFVLALIMVRKYVKLKVHFFRDIVAYSLLIIESLLVIFNMKNYMMLNGMIVVILAAMYVQELTEMVKKCLKK